MKISKLFHWLYATLMFLPLVFFIPSVFYYGFNEHATNTETTTINYKYESNEVNSFDDVLVNHIYLFNYELDMGSMTDDFFILKIVKCDSFYYEDANIVQDETIVTNYVNNDENYIIFYNDNTDEFEIKFSNSNGYTTLAGEYGDVYFNKPIIYFDNQEYLDNFKSYLSAIAESWEIPLSNLLPQYTDYNVIESVSVNTDDTITDKLNSSWNAIFDLPMFSWTKTTFVSGAFVYISGLFGVQANNPLNYLFAYFVSISICWLVFDVLLYVPNLAHRWLDKGAID